MSKNYTHSKVFDTLKGIREDIDKNLSSLQYLQTLDHFLWKALEPIAAECPSLFFNYIAKVVARQALRASAKLTSDDRTKLPIYLFNTLVAANTDSKKAFESAKTLHLNRGIFFGFVSLFLNKTRKYVAIHNGTLHIPDPAARRTYLYNVERSLGLRPGGKLYAAILQVESWDTKARKFKDSIVQKYTRMTLLQAKATYQKYNHYVELDDVIQTYMMVVNRAINRCDSRHGVLTSFIQNWYKSAKGDVAKLAEGQTDQSYESLTEDYGDSVHEILGVSLPDEDRELREHVAYISKAIDPVGLVRTSLGIPEYVSPAMRSILHEFTEIHD